MKKMFVLALALVMVMLVGVAALADEIPAGSVSFPVKWNVEPKIYFSVSFGENKVDFADGVPTFGNPNFSNPYIFETRVANIDDEYFGTEGIKGDEITAEVKSNDYWVLEFNKPRLVSDNDHETTVPVYAKRTLEDCYTCQSSETDWFTTNDKIIQNMGVYEITWDLKVEFNNWNTRYGNYENIYTITVTQF